MDLLGVSPTLNAENSNKLIIAVICESHLIRLLSNEYHVFDLIPGTVSCFLEEIRPDYVVVQASKTSSGVWMGSHEGRSMSPDLEAIRTYGELKMGRIIVIRDKFSLDSILFTLSKDIFPNQHFFERVEGKPRRSQVYEIVHNFSRSLNNTV
ncbi:hypothetical protein [Glutamicibacter ardleyensis]|uniref:hypothetical protein n=1 Tax=Glutamicibacter ardleyensis TaxID=225894 RepID=UPI0016660A40|nr:hypothetical protein [Glutamicibacter ardleyensis]